MAVSPGTIVDYLVPKPASRPVNLLRDGLLVVGFSIFTALCAHVAFPLPFTLVPVTLQTLAVLLTGAALGSKRGGLALLLYLAEGAVGLPVFSPIPAGPAGLAALLGVTAGYLWAFPIAAFVTGWLCERRLDRSFLTSALAMLPGTLIIYLIGVTWLAVAFHLGPLAAIQ
ncbi:MAG TPA: biotin transporter BioY, partial [Ktedonobacteraceae bacterium]|nr:biotin transporter BioY [Ktedonobacteraceae bacterium]